MNEIEQNQMKTLAKIYRSEAQQYSTFTYKILFGLL